MESGLCAHLGMSVMETQIHMSRVEGLARTLGFENCFLVSSSRRSGGLGMYWNNEISVEIFQYLHYHIDARMSPRGGGGGE
jgi:hypothetical protein